MKGYVYVIKCKDENIKDCYIGSTTNIVSRKKYHKHVCNNPNTKAYNYKVYEFIRNNGGFDNFTLETIKEVEVENKKELAHFELEQYTLLQPSLNSNLPLIDIEMKDYQKVYYKEKYQTYHKKRYQEKKDEYKQRNNNRYKLFKTLLENHKNKNNIE
jgi:predicted GIY-YIG superfamily endonuclease